MLSRHPRSFACEGDAPRQAALVCRHLLGQVIAETCAPANAPPPAASGSGLALCFFRIAWLQIETGHEGSPRRKRPDSTIDLAGTIHRTRNARLMYRSCLKAAAESSRFGHRGLSGEFSPVFCRDGQWCRDAVLRICYARLVAREPRSGMLGEASAGPLAQVLQSSQWCAGGAHGGAAVSRRPITREPF